MKITKLQMENFKRIVAVDITPGENAVVIGGRNAQGKTSVLDGIMAALSGRKGTKEIVRPIRDGESKASVVVELDDLVVTRKWTASGSTLTVSPKGSTSKLTSPQAILDKLIGALAFDPLAFAESDAKTQVETLIDLVGREAFDALAAERRAAYENRTDMNREVKRFRAQRDAIGPVEPVEPVDVAALMTEIRVANDRSRLLDRHAAITAHIGALQEELAEIVTEGAALPTSRGLDVLQVELEQVEATNERARLHAESRRLDDALERAESVAAKHTEMIESLDTQKAALIKSASLPVDGLAFDEDGVTFNGVPFQQSSAAERLKVSVAMAMAMNPDLRVICIRDASLLDDDSKRALVALAEQHDYQIWLEVVGDGVGESGVVIEDGAVKA